MANFLSKLFSQHNYLRSNAIVEVDFLPSSKAKILAKNLMAGKVNRQEESQKLLDELSRICSISGVNLKVSEKKQWHKKWLGRVVFKQYGYYKPKTKYIYIQNLTSIRGQTVAPRTFLNTLIHEWLHHYDFEKLKLRSIHSKGFYLRLNSLKALLLTL